MKKTALLFGLVVLAVFFAGGCSRQQNKTPTVFYSFSGVNGEANSYIVANGNKAAVIDASAADTIIGKLKETGLKPEYIILTHGHFDHIGGVDAIKQEFPGIRVLIHSADLSKLADPEKNLSTGFGFRVAVTAQASPIIDGQRLPLGDADISVISTPGHTPGSICLSVGELLFSGDTLFKSAVGRTDFPNGSEKDLQLSLQKLGKFPASTQVLPGHGDATTLGEEWKNNPFLQ